METIKRVKVNGKDATVAYLDDDFNSIEPDKATLVKVLFDDGGMMFLVPKVEKSELTTAELHVPSTDWDQKKTARKRIRAAIRAV